MAVTPQAPQQARSRQTQAQLLSAAIDVLAAKGLAGVTIPGVAAAAKLSTGAVYRRFADKDALIRAAFLRLLETSEEANRAAFQPDRFAGLGLDQTLRAISQAVVLQYRGHERLLKALDQFLETQTDVAFREQALELIQRNLQRLIDVILPFRSEIRAADPQRAITFALLDALTVIEAHKLHTPLLWRRVLPLDDDALAAETAQAMLAYLTSATSDR